MMPGWEKEKHKILIAAVLLVFFYYFQIRPELEAVLARHGTRFQSLKAELAAMNNSISRSQQTLIEYTKTSAELEALKTAVSGQGATNIINRSLSSFAEIFEVKISDISYDEPVRNASVSSLPVNMTLKGTFFRIGDFIKKTEETFPNVEWTVKNLSPKQYPQLEARLVLNIRQRSG
ncbi:MAG: hypothetical protein PHQ23_06770 [Candidatus Wallbacteria bacterium]|nr:hypothetical protein [Candidatus Wallbacteria bacterium]